MTSAPFVAINVKGDQTLMASLVSVLDDRASLPTCVHGDGGDVHASASANLSPAGIINFNARASSGAVVGLYYHTVDLRSVVWQLCNY